MKILCVDDDPNILEACQRNFRKRFSIDTALGGKPALALMESNGPYAVIVADMQMPGMNGVEFLTQAQRKAPDTVRIMLTGNADQKTAVDAVNKGHVYQFLNKPCPPEMFGMALGNGVRQYQLITAERELLEKTLNGAINMLTNVLSSADPVSFGCGEVLRDYMRTFARALNISQTWDLESAAMLSPIGYVTIPPDVNQKVRWGQELSKTEKVMLTRVPEVGAKLLTNIPRLESVAKMVLYQNKNYDGSGFPVDSVVGDDIPLGSRILKVLSDLAQLERTAVSRAKALGIMQGRVGCYDPRVLDAAFVCFDVYLATATSAKASSRAVSLEELEPGMNLSADVRTNDDSLIVRAGTSVSQMILERLRNMDALGYLKTPIQVDA